MKKIIKYITVACLGIISLNSCSDDNDIIQLDSSNFTNPVNTTTGTTAELSESTQNQIAFTFNWTPASYGVNSPIKYEIEVTDAQGNFDDAKILTSTTSTTFEITGTDLNNFVVEKLRLAEQTEGTIKYRIASLLGTYGGSDRLYSEIKSITLTPFSTSKVTPWGLVGSATPNGWNGPDVPFWKTTTPGILEAYTTLAPDASGVMELKIRKNNEWVEDMGGSITSSNSNGFSGSLTSGGSNIVVPTAGSYRIEINLNDNTFTATKFQWGIVGDATPNGWNGPDTQVFSYDGLNDVWYINRATLNNGLIKFRKNSEWVEDFGGSNGILTQGGSNIAVTAGTYNIIMDIKNLKYSITPVQ